MRVYLGDRRNYVVHSQDRYGERARRSVPYILIGESLPIKQTKPYQDQPGGVFYFVVGSLTVHSNDTSTLWLHRIMASSPGFHPGHRGSILLGATTLRPHLLTVGKWSFEPEKGFRLPLGLIFSYNIQRRFSWLH